MKRWRQAMTRRIYEFMCPDGIVFEEYIDSEQKEAICPHCSVKSQRIISAVRLGMSMGVDSAIPTMSDKWAKMHVDEAKRQNAKIDPNPSS